ncbi:DUF6771 family protein [Sphingomonas immobilis]|uniref:DUF6771 family protein n=1 Tax=Sphingomonas immobilis TaxID=3063997 RepID=UPI003133C829
MTRFALLTPDTAIAESILAAPGWARVGITMPDPCLRERAAQELARAIAAGVASPCTTDPDQFIATFIFEAAAWHHAVRPI